jgi:hypothetical protein
MDFLHDGDRRRHGETAAAVFFGNERGEKSRLGQRLNELSRIGAFAIDLAPVLTRTASRIGANSASLAARVVMP